MQVGETQRAVPGEGITAIFERTGSGLRDVILACDDVEGTGVEVRAAAPASLADKTTSTIDDCDLWGGKTAALCLTNLGNCFQGLCLNEWASGWP